MRRLALAAVLLLVPTLGLAEVIDTAGAKPGTYILTVNADGTVSVSGPTNLVRLKDLGGPTNPPPVDPDLSPFAQEVQRQTAAVLQAGGSKTTGAALSAVYSLVSGGVADGSIAPDKAFSATKAGTDAIMAAQADRDKWTKWRTDMSTALNTLQGQGLLTTKEQIAGVLGDISNGLDKATGNTLEPRAVAKIKAADAWAFDTVDGKADGILDGIDLAKLIELIKLVMELLKLFGLGV